MKILVPHSTPKRRLSATKQAARELGDSQDFLPMQFAQQLTLFDIPQENPFKKRRKPQISIIPGISLTSREKYRVMAGDKLLGTHLTMDEAIELYKGGAR